MKLNYLALLVLDSSLNGKLWFREKPGLTLSIICYPVCGTSAVKCEALGTQSAFICNKRQRQELTRKSRLLSISK